MTPHEETFVTLAKEMKAAKTAERDAEKSRAEADRIHSATKAKCEIIEKKLKDYVGRNQPVKQTVVQDSLVRVEWSRCGDGEKVSVTVEPLIY